VSCAAVCGVRSPCHSAVHRSCWSARMQPRIGVHAPRTTLGTGLARTGTNTGTRVSSELQSVSINQVQNRRSLVLARLITAVTQPEDNAQWRPRVSRQTQECTRMRPRGEFASPARRCLAFCPAARAACARLGLAARLEQGVGRHRRGQGLHPRHVPSEVRSTTGGGTLMPGRSRRQARGTAL